MCTKVRNILNQYENFYDPLLLMSKKNHTFFNSVAEEGDW